jgi:hypothetical protein
MTGIDRHRKQLIAGISIVALFGILYATTGYIPLIGQAAAYLALTVLPGLGVYLMIERRSGTAQTVLGALLISPVVTGACGTLFMLAALSSATAATLSVCALSVVALIAAWTCRKDPGPAMPGSRGRSLLLFGTILLFCAAAGYLPLTHEWWRQWSDAWFHGAVVSQIDTYGLPPEDPYFAGMSLQYMWFYHVLIITLSKASGISPMVVMPLLNMQALAGFALSAFLLSKSVKKSFSYGFFSLIAVVLAMNAGIWFFLPLKVLRSLIGDIRGWEELVRNFSLVPFEKETATEWVTVFFNQTFLLNKFIVSTAFSLGLCYMAAFWYSGTHYLARGTRGPLALIFFAVAGMLLLHSLVAFIVVASVAAAVGLLWLARGAVHDYSGRRILMAILAVATAIAVSAPYLYSVMHLKESEQLFPLSISFKKSAGIIISCALVIFLAAFQVRRLIRVRTMSSYLLLFGAATTFVFCNVIRLPASNTYDKLPFFVFFPLAIIGSWTLADRFARRHATQRFRRNAVVLALVLLLPVNILLVASYYNSPAEEQVSADERAVSRWVAEHTERDALFFDSDDRVFLLVTGPRRYYWGRQSYAEQWGYPKAEIAKRKHARDNLYSSDPVDQKTFSTLAAIDTDVYIIVRDDDPSTPRSRRFAEYGSVFSEVHRTGAIAIFEIDRRACLDHARSR